jgi:hypothetical protein
MRLTIRAEDGVAVLSRAQLSMLHSVAVEFDLVQPVPALRCLLYQFGQLRPDPLRQKRQGAVLVDERPISPCCSPFPIIGDTYGSCR